MKFSTESEGIRLRRFGIKALAVMVTAVLLIAVGDYLAPKFGAWFQDEDALPICAPGETNLADGGRCEVSNIPPTLMPDQSFVVTKDGDVKAVKPPAIRPNPGSMQ